jgi:hypothetical protein
MASQRKPEIKLQWKGKHKVYRKHTEALEDGAKKWACKIVKLEDGLVHAVESMADYNALLEVSQIMR